MFFPEEEEKTKGWEKIRMEEQVTNCNQLCNSEVLRRFNFAIRKITF